MTKAVSTSIQERIAAEDRLPSSDEVQHFIRRGREMRAAYLREAISGLFSTPGRAADAAVEKVRADAVAKPQKRSVA